MIVKLSKAAMKYERLDTIMYLACETDRISASIGRLEVSH
jgi:hypothetical protein